MTWEPPDFSEGVKRFITFHKLEPKNIGRFPSLKIPRTIALVGSSSWITYRSDKWENKNHDYIHEHDRGVRTYRSDIRGASVEVPSWIRSTTTLVRLGHCLGFCYHTAKGEEIEAKTRNPYPELYCIASGKALLIVEDKHKLVAMMWGGKLEVLAEGIAG